MIMKRIQWVTVALLIAAGCARAKNESIGRDVASAVEVATPLAPLDQKPSVGAGDTPSAAFQKSYNDEAAGAFELALSDLAGIATTGYVQYVVELRRAWLLYRLGRNAESVTAYGKASALDPTAVEPRLGSLPPLGALRRWTDVESTAREILRKDSGNYTATIRLAYALYSQAKYAEAEATYRALLALYPSDVDVRAGLGWSLLKENKGPDAQTVFAEVLAIAPKNSLAIEGAAAARH